MKKPPIFNLKAWSKIHPPLPRTPRESQQLLNSLTSSFRRQLDHEYPTSAAPDHGDDGGRPPTKPESSAHMADKHFNNILENALFRVVPSKKQLEAVDRERLLKEPMTIFDKLVASGSVTDDNLWMCLKAQFVMSTTTKGDRRKAMAASRAGSKVVSWWYASDPEVRLQLFKRSKSYRYLCRFLAAEGTQDTVMAWLRMLLRPHDAQKPSIPADTISTHLLSHFVATEVEYGRGLASALTYYTQACQLISPSDQPHEEYRQHERRMLFNGGLYLNKWIIQHGQAPVRDVPVSTYEEYTRSVSEAVQWKNLCVALPLYHPTSPDPDPFLRMVDKLFLKVSKSRTETFRDVFIRASFAALRLLIDREQFRDATRLVEYIQKLLPDKDTPGTMQDTRYHVSPEEEYLLDRLQLSLA